MAPRIPVLPMVTNPGHYNRFKPRNLYLPQLPNSCHLFLLRSSSDVFSGIGIKLGDRSFLWRFLDIVDVISNHLLRLRVIDHDRFCPRRISFANGIHRDISRFFVLGFTGRRGVLVGQSRPFFGVPALTLGCFAFGDHVGRNPNHCACGNTNRHRLRCTCSRRPCKATGQNTCASAKQRAVCFRRHIFTSGE
jgi:hypothetical protein